jgi:glyoxylase-like metal-dependent hydrolase (beta-lactamase superfamily II)
MISSGKDSLLIWGDIIHVPEIQIPRPEVTMAFDIDPGQAAATRRRVFDMVATDGQAVAGMHMHFPGMLHLVRRGDGYAMVNDGWYPAM